MGPRRCRASGKAPLGGGPGGKVADTHVLIFPGNRGVDDARLFPSGPGRAAMALGQKLPFPGPASQQLPACRRVASSESLTRKGGWSFGVAPA